MIEIKIHGLGSSGDGVGRLEDGQVVFVPGALPGDRVQIGAPTRRRKVYFAELKKVLDPSPDRIKSRCTVDACGGCPLKSLDGPAQHRMKTERLLESLRRLGGLEPEALFGKLHTSGDGWTYRHRVRLHSSWCEDRWEVGYHARGSRRVVPFSTCPVLLPALSDKVRWLQPRLALLPKAARLSDLELAIEPEGPAWALKIRSDGPSDLFKPLAEEVGQNDLSGLLVVGRGQRRVWGDIALQYRTVSAPAGVLWFEPGLFTQANPRGNEALMNLVWRGLVPQKGMKILEFHAGLGNFTIPIARAGASLTAIEIDGRALKMAGRNLDENGRVAQHFKRSDADFVKKTPPEIAPHAFDAVLLDPPRTGAVEVSKWLAGTTISKIVYVSCDVATLARDLRVLKDGGYRLVALDAVDMFAQTSHVEAVAVLER